MKRTGPLNKWWDLNRDKYAVRTVTPKRGETFDDALARFLDEMPRRPSKFLRFVAELERVRAVKLAIATKKEKGRARYLRRMGRG